MTAATSEVRVATLADVPAIAQMALTFLRTSPLGRWVDLRREAVEDGIKQVLATGGVCFVAERGTSIYGALLGTMSSPWFAGHQRTGVELGWWIDPEHRGSLSGIRMLHAFEAWVRDRDPSAIAMSDLPAWSQESLFQRCGYELAERSWIKGIN